MDGAAALAARRSRHRPRALARRRPADRPAGGLARRAASRPVTARRPARAPGPRRPGPAALLDDLSAGAGARLARWAQRPGACRSAPCSPSGWRSSLAVLAKGPIAPWIVAATVVGLARRRACRAALALAGAVAPGARPRGGGSGRHRSSPGRRAARSARRRSRRWPIARPSAESSAASTATSRCPACTPCSRRRCSGRARSDSSARSPGAGARRGRAAPAAPRPAAATSSPGRLPAWVGFELAATKLPHYPLPLHVPLLLLSARWLLRLAARRPVTWPDWLRWAARRLADRSGARRARGVGGDRLAGDAILAPRRRSGPRRAPPPRRGRRRCEGASRFPRSPGRSPAGRSRSSRQASPCPTGRRRGPRCVWRQRWRRPTRRRCARSPTRHGARRVCRCSPGARWCGSPPTRSTPGSKSIRVGSPSCPPATRRGRPCCRSVEGLDIVHGRAVELALVTSPPPAGPSTIAAGAAAPARLNPEPLRR